ncbi:MULTISPECIES: MBL fold metallo-hydrolase [unclassified Desulfurobacterium]|uniref:MBL fold metallo-hydrolase n=1 Tax=Desulfurobacterium sp. TC5-1 TaxID=1158318 RepID=UPI0003B77AB3|nr:MBL fold metallo-hydrolase [Desulfurobacterium sp. TC5-1]
MIINVAGCYGSKSKLMNLVTFIISNKVAVDCGNLFAKEVNREEIEHILVTHSHMDHLQDLPFFIDEIPFNKNRKSPLTVYGNDEVIQTLKNHIFNGTVWPELKNFKMANGEDAVILKRLEEGKLLRLSNLTVYPLKANHTVKTFGFAIFEENKGILISGDTYKCKQMWNLVKNENRIKAVFIDVSYPSSMVDLSRKAKHYCVSELKKDLEENNISKELPIYAYHLKFPFVEEIKEELSKLKWNIKVLSDGKTVEV